MRIPITSCPKCGKMLDSVSDPTGEYMPSPGDFTVCFGCAHLMVFNSGFALREPTLWEAYRASTTQDPDAAGSGRGDHLDEEEPAVTAAPEELDAIRARVEAEPSWGSHDGYRMVNIRLDDVRRLLSEVAALRQQRDGAVERYERVSAGYIRQAAEIEALQRARDTR